MVSKLPQREGGRGGGRDKRNINKRELLATLENTTDVYQDRMITTSNKNLAVFELYPSKKCNISVYVSHSLSEYLSLSLSLSLSVSLCLFVYLSHYQSFSVSLFLFFSLTLSESPSHPFVGTAVISFDPARCRVMERAVSTSRSERSGRSSKKTPGTEPATEGGRKRKDREKEDAERGKMKEE
jgi:hypothetical protein